jgi:ribonucleoside-triphosphate reductase
MSVEKYVKQKYDEYVNKEDWRVKENSNSFFSFGALNKYMIGKDSALIWKDYYDKFDKRIMEAHNTADAHCHDLGSLSSYCFGASLYDLLLLGIQGVPNIAVSAPAKRLRTITSQIANIMTIFQNETAGAIAYSSWNVYLAPFLYFDKLERDEKLRNLGLSITYTKDPYIEKVDLEYTALDFQDIAESVQNMIFALNSNSRGGAEPSFSNLTLDFTVLKTMQDMNIVIGGKENSLFTYKDFQKEADILIDVFSKAMYKGDGNGNAQIGRAHV